MILTRIHLGKGGVDTNTDKLLPAFIGADRAERAHNYHAHLVTVEAAMGMNQEARTWTADWVPNIKHDGRAM